MDTKNSISIIIPTFNGARRITRCLDALRRQTAGHEAEIIVVDDGSTDDTVEVVRQYPGVKLISQRNAGPAAARNRGAREASGSFLLFTDDDCEPETGWLDGMLAPFVDPQVIGVKGAYRTKQTRLAAKFVQLEYEDRYRYMKRHVDIDFIDTYSAAFRRANFEEMNGYDTSFPVACAEDIELSYRMSARGWKMRFAPDAVVYHQHPDSFGWYFRKKFKFAFWRVLAIRKNPSKAVSDSHTPQLMKLQLLLAPMLLLSVLLDLFCGFRGVASGIVLLAFIASTLPFAIRAAGSHLLLGLFSPAILAVRSCSQLLGISCGIAGAKARTEKPATATD